MPRARRPSISCVPGDGQPGIHRRLRRWVAGELPGLQAAIERQATDHKSDRYRKHFSTLGHLCLLLFHGLSGSASLRRSHAAFPHCAVLAAMSGLDVDPESDDAGVSYSQFAASNTSRTAQVVADLLPALIARVQRLEPTGPIPRELRVFDGTFLRLSLDRASWVTPSQQRVGVQVLYTPALELPEHLLISKRHINDYVAMDQAILQDPERLAALAGQTLAFDLGYTSHDRFRQLRQADVHFVTRRHPQSRVEVQASLPVQQHLPHTPHGRITVLADQRITLGSPNNRRARPLPNWRLIKAAVAPRRPMRPRKRRSSKQRRRRQHSTPLIYEILTDRWDLDAAEVVQFYLWRWTIETFFCWLKHSLHVIRLLGTSQNAVDLSVWLAILVHLLCRLAAAVVGLASCTVALLERLRDALRALAPADVPT